MNRKRRNKEEKAPYVSPAEFGRIYFSNKLYEDDAFMYKINDDSEFDKDSFPETDIPAIKDEMTIGINSEKLKAALAVGIYLDDVCALKDSSLEDIYDYGGAKKHFAASGYIDDWFIEYSPVPEVSFALHESIFLDAACMPIYDNEFEAGNIGSTGFTLVYRPHYVLNNLRLALTTPTIFKDTDEYHGTFNKKERLNWVNGESDPKESDYEYEDRRFNLGFGAIYDNEFLQVGFSAKNLIGEDNQVGTYITAKNVFGHLNNFNINLGLAYSANVVTDMCDLTAFGGILGTKIFSGYATYSTKIVDLATEFAWNGFALGGGDSEEAKKADYSKPNPAHKDFVVRDNRIDTERKVWDCWDFYVATSAKFKICNWFSIDLGGRFLMDTTDEKELNEDYEAAPFVAGGFLSFNFAVKRHTFGIGADADYCDGNIALKAPIYWKFSY